MSDAQDWRDYDTNGVRYRWQMPDSDRGLAAEIADDDDGTLTVWVSVNGPGWSRPVGNYATPEAEWMAETWPQIMASLALMHHRQENTP